MPEPKNTILVVDDTPANLQLLESILQEQGYAVRAAISGRLALKAAQAQAPDLILLDINMPDMSGFDVCRILKTDPNLAGIPVIFISAAVDTADKLRAFEEGGVDYITKPFQHQEVLARVVAHLELKRYRDYLEEMVQERTRDVQLTQDAVIYGLGILAEYRDPETGLHLKRTQRYVKILATHLQHHPRFQGCFDDTTIRLLYLSAPLHDIGKVGVPDTILLKPGPLTADEFDQMKRHTTYGREVIDRIAAGMNNDSAASFLSLAGDCAASHHEYWNGKGYSGLAGDAIPVAGRLMALADVYDALTSRRAYKPAFTHERAFTILTSGDGRTVPEQFDPAVLQAFVELRDTFKLIAFTLRDEDTPPATGF
ncbi:response regulator [Trichlorobacter ammonificans]|uniref:Cyclic di-GMP phosphodiesterase VC_1348 n=1 Tax=Trichlorobacter ammonificans TaxID=2916410 RepID=A0ABM9DA66_9BACT|nr:response regulator [Trichlorobacter ammonificans]CAH2032046.1 putative cyclic di-GMP phosphodiesterase VC_1348 [Trichlorobacter ammonificans]